MGILSNWCVQRWCAISAAGILLSWTLPFALCQRQGDVRLQNGPTPHEGRPEIFYNGVWLSLCYSSAYSTPQVICRQLGYPSAGAMAYLARSYGEAPGETLRKNIYCGGFETNITSCSMTNTDNNCEPRNTLGVSCNATTSATTIRLRGGSSPYEGRLEMFMNGVWGTVCRIEDQNNPAYVQSTINANVVCKQLFGSSYGGKYYLAQETPSRFGILSSGAVLMSRVQCNGNETSLFSCSFSNGGQDERCRHEYDATLRCVPVPAGCGGFLVSETGTVTSPGYPAGYTYGNDTECVWKLKTTKRRTIQLSFPAVLSFNNIGTSNYIQVVTSGFYSYATSYGSALANFSNSNQDTVYIMLKSVAGKIGLAFRAVWQPVIINCNTTIFINTSESASLAYISSIDYYPPELDCYYLIQFRTLYKARFSFYRFNIADSVNGICKDYIELFDGNSMTAPLLGKYCGGSTPTLPSTTQNYVYAHFHSDDIDEAKPGFFLRVSGFEPAPVVTFLNASSGVILSPGYPNNYRNETNYEWYIFLPSYMSVTLTFNQFLASCDLGTRLRIEDGYPSGNYLVDVCGNGRTEPVLSNTNVMRLRLDSAPGVTTGTAFNVSWKAECRRSYTSASGIITSPQYPNAYPRNMDCTWVITRDTGYYVTLSINSFSLDSRTLGQCGDYLSVRDGSSEDAPLLINKLCGTSVALPFNVSSTQPSLYIQFHSDDVSNAEGLGFQISYTSQIKECKSQVMTAGSGSFTSPGYPFPYASYTYCIWKITIPFKGIVELTFDAFAVGMRSNQDCSGAFVRIYDSNDVEVSRVINTLCGVGIAVPPIASTGRSLTIVLNSFGSSPQQAIGFSARYRSISNVDLLQYDLFPFGAAIGDSELGLSDGHVTVDAGIPYGSRIEKNIFVGLHGLVSFGKIYYWPELPNVQSVICVYCAYINNSDNNGGIYYKLHTSDAHGFLTKANKEVKEFAPLQRFNAQFVLVVTWDRVRQGRYRLVDYDPNINEGNATFQLALISNGLETYALMYYKTGAMTWTQRGIWSYVIMGVSDGSLDNYRTSLYSKTSKAYIIDAFPGNAGRMGTWLYKVGQVPANPEAVCKIWITRNNNFASSTNLGFSRLPSCPCYLRDVWAKTRYMWTVAREEDGGKIVCFRMNMANSEANYPFGKECCYGRDLTDPLTYDMWLSVWPPSRRAGASLAYNPVYWHLREPYEIEDREGHETCCHPSVSWSLCRQFFMLRTPGQCRPDIPFRFSWLIGDPHFVTLDEREYSFNGFGEFIILSANNFMLQGRTSPTVNDNGAEVRATVFTAFAAQENGTRIFVQLDPNTNNSMIIYGGETDYTLQFQRDGQSFLVDLVQYTMLRDNNSLVVAFPSGMSLAVSVGVRSLLIRLSTPLHFRNKTQGLMGNFNGVKNDDFRLPNGTMLPDSLTDRQLHLLFGNAWAVTAQNSIMRYGPREGPSNYTRPGYLPIFLDEISAPARQAAQAVCGTEDRACIFDYIATGSSTFALATKQARLTALKDNAAVENSIPTLEIPQNITLMSNVTTTFRVKGSDQDVGDTLIYYLASDGGGALRINSTTGEITATINEKKPIAIRVYAVDSKGGQSLVYTVPVILCPSCSGHGQCNVTAALENTLNSEPILIAVCSCGRGWTGVNCSENLNACLSNPCHPLQTCVDRTPQQEVTSGVGYTCSPCPAGYASPVESPNQCLDIDECSSRSLNGCQGNCTNTDGSYTCSCLPGYRLSSDLRTCVDVNECAERSHNCQQMCNNTKGSYQCSCREGFTLDEGSLSACVPSQSTTTVCTGSRCSQGCRGVPGPSAGTTVAQCFCFAGYDLDPVNKTVCRDHDECSDAIPPCDQKCNNTLGSFTCSCYGGFQLNADQRTCSPCPDQTYGPDCSMSCACDPRGALRCHPSTGCLCRPGWTGSDCSSDVDECVANPNLCGWSGGAVCRNTNGSYACVCRDGYQLDGNGVCQDVNECSSSPCSTLERCTNIPGGFYCSCMPGYNRINGSCFDIDECKEIHNCQQKCVNVPGTFRCDCNFGYRLNVDRVTCSQLSNPCSGVQSLTCAHGCTLDDVTNAPVCFCRSGFSLNADRRTCSDVNECATAPSPCSHTCSNTVGGFLCSCPAGMRLDNDGTTCLACPLGTYGVNCTSTCACGVGASGCDVISGCQCMPGWNGIKCDRDFNECDVSNINQTCLSKRARCVNTPGSYRCQCALGYRFNSAGQCEDINECESSPCSQVCENSPGSYRCLCKPGFAVDNKTGECTDVNECALPINNDCDQSCDNTIGSYRCSCSQPGYTLSNDGRTCSATIHCPTRSDCDSSNGGCMVSCTGEQRCFCNQGFVLAADGRSCIVEECPRGTFGIGCKYNCTCNAEHTTSCSHVNGSCTCARGWKGANCDQDVNECTQGVCGDHASCSNTLGSFICACAAGYVKNLAGSCVECPENTYGAGCNNTCKCHGPNTVFCDPVTGSCTCKAGWEGATCVVDINECASPRTHTCSAADNRVCVNIVGSYNCDCTWGYREVAGRCLSSPWAFDKK